MIVKSYGVSNDDRVIQHAAVVAVDKLKAVVTEEPMNMPSLAAACSALCAVCDTGLPDRCLAAKSGAYDVLVKAICAGSATDSVPLVLSALLSLVDGQPDILEVQGATHLISILRNSDTDTDITVRTTVLNIIQRCCILHEANRQQFVALDVIPLTANVLTVHHSNKQLVQSACAVFSALTLDDDVRVPFGKSHEHAKAIVIEGNALGLLLQLTSEYTGDSEVLMELFQLIGQLSVRDEFCQKVLELGGVTSIFSAFQSNISDKGLVRSLLISVKALAGCDKVKVEVVKAGGLETVIDSIQRHQRNAGICEAACAALAAVVLRFPGHCDAVIDAGGPEVISTTLEVHQTSAAVQKSACMAVRNIVARRPELADAFLSCGIETLLRSAMASHPSCHDEIHAALRDLGCQVELKERWTGAGRQLEH